jgi:hypothetical protein
MNYKTFREEAQDGDVLFLTVNKKNILSRITSFFTKSPVTHAAFVFWYGKRLMLVESTTNGGIRIVFASTYDNRSVYRIAAPKAWDDIEETALSKSGTATYGWFSAIYIGIREVAFKHFNIKLPVDRNNRHKACSEFVAECLGLDDVDLSPGALFNKLGGQL